MGKSNGGNSALLPSVDECAVTNTQRTMEIHSPPQPTDKPSNLEIKAEMVQIAVPFGPLLGGYMSNRFDVQRLTQRQAESIHRVLSGLRMKSTRLKDGTIVDCPQHVVKWIFECLEAKIHTSASGKTV